MEIRSTDHTAAPGPSFSGVKPAAPAATTTRGVEQLAQKETPAGTPAAARKELAQALSSINDVLKDRAPGLEFSFDKDDARLVVKVVDRDTNEVIRQMPSREALEIAKALDKLQSLLSKQSA
jgi:flagellar protein FlaG